MIENWQYEEDSMLANPPEQKESKFKCEHCGEPFYPGERYYEIEGEKICYGCTMTWLDDLWHFADEQMCYGE